MTKSYKESKDGKVVFEEEAHSYTINGKKLVSGTTFLKQFFSEFDAKGTAKKIANGFKARNQAKFKSGSLVTALEKKKATQKYWLTEWKESATHGTFVHMLMENYILEIDNKPNNIHNIESMDWRDAKKFLHGSCWFDNYYTCSTEPILHPEYIVYNEDLCIAGQIDLLCQNGDVYDLIDWKTNKSIDKKSKYNEKCSTPLEEYEDCNFFKYTLQLSLYAYMLELTGKKIGKLILLHLTEDGAVEMEVKYEKELIERLVKWQSL